MAAGGGLSRSERKAAERVRRLREEQQRERLRQVSRILRKAAAERSAEEGRLLAESEDLVTELQGRSRRREGLKRRQEEVCDDPEELRRKVRELAGAVRSARHLVVYTGAGISTVCTSCIPNREYVRVFDVTERTALHRHLTGRTCHKCGTQLRDTIVHFGERGTLGQPLNWEAATEAASKADTILCLGSSLKVLKKYPRLWCMTKPPSRRPKLYIVNLQWTPKDDWAALKLHGKCDDVMRLLMDELGLEIPVYNRWQDPIFSLATPLRAGEEGSHSRKSLCRSREEPPPGDQSAPLASATPILGGWFGRGCAKRAKRKKAA
ncbi:NAD-dependent protein deacetylase sirtuin-7 isoform X2 [Rattus norvegicus]|uniref:NAD-dependent protein deacetylase sirtuin-7 isoform X2 n=1 Tax=Rattus norvegicus TaxID=10116 RepID=UPI00191702CC|nr:NAD-dependent protein deacetylase sirtuin-7 isoform X2 [Rattus norvegicus]